MAAQNRPYLPIKRCRAFGQRTCPDEPKQEPCMRSNKDPYRSSHAVTRGTGRVSTTASSKRECPWKLIPTRSSSDTPTTKKR